MNQTCMVGACAGTENLRADVFDLQDDPAPRDDLLFPTAAVIAARRGTC